jgi:cytochrome P450
MTYFDPFDPLLRSDPYAVFRHHVGQGPIQRGGSSMPGYENTWYFFGFEEARQLLRSGLHMPVLRTEIFTQEISGIKLSEDRALLWQHLSEWPLFQNPPMHTHRRALVAHAFRDSSLKKLGSYIKATAGTLLDKALPNKTIEIQQEFSYPLAISAITRVLGLPPPDIAWLKGITRKMANVLDLGYVPAAYAPGISALNELIAYVEESIAWKRQHLSDDLLSQLLRPLEDNTTLGDNLVVTLVTQILIAGQETVSDGIGNGVNLFASHPDQLQLAQCNPQLIENAVQEILRFDSPVQFTSSRTVTSDMQFGDIQIAAGEITIVALGACNRDGRRFDNPDQFDIKRDLSGPELSFGHGIHYCLGVHFARMVMHIAFEELLGKLPKNWILNSPVQWRDNAVFRGPAALTLTL